MNPLAMMMMAQPRLAAAPAAPEPVQPTLGTITPYVRADATDTAQITFNHPTTTGDILVIGCWRSNGNPSPTVTGATIAASALTQADQATINGSGRGGVYAGWIRGVAVGEQSVVIDITRVGGAFTSKRHIFWAIDVADMRPGPGSPIGAVAKSVLNTSADNIAITIDAINAASRLVGLGGMVGTLDPFTITNATKLDEDRTGNSLSGVHTSAALWGVAIDAVGERVITVTSNGPTADDDRFAIGVELLPS